MLCYIITFPIPIQHRGTARGHTHVHDPYDLRPWASQQLAKVLGQHGIRRPLLCTDPGLVELGMVAELLGRLGNDCATTIFDGTPPNPTQEAVEAAAKMYRQADCDGVVAFGGGSSMDLAKAVALAVTHEGDLLGYTAGLGGTAKIGPVAPTGCHPDDGWHRQVRCQAEPSSSWTMARSSFSRARHLVPRTAICDPSLTSGLPPLLTAATGMDAMTHCIEALLSPQVNPPAEAVACATGSSGASARRTCFVPCATEATRMLAGK